MGMTLGSYFLLPFHSRFRIFLIMILSKLFKIQAFSLRRSVYYALALSLIVSRSVIYLTLQVSFPHYKGAQWDRSLFKDLWH